MIPAVSLVGSSAVRSSALCRWRQQAERAGAADFLALLENAVDLGPFGLVFFANSHYGKSLLLHAHWRGLLDLSNPEQHNRASSMSSRPHADPDPLGLIADTDGLPMPVADWTVIARMRLTYDQVVRLFGEPPKAARHLFKQVGGRTGARVVRSARTHVSRPRSSLTVSR